MCSIIGYCGICDDLDEFQKGFDKTISRGPDDSRIVDTGNGLLGFQDFSNDCDEQSLWKNIYCVPYYF